MNNKKPDIDLVLQGQAISHEMLTALSTIVVSHDAQAASTPNGYRFRSVRDDASVRAAVEQCCRTAEVDYAFIAQAASLSDYRLLVMDMDSTLITIECIDEIADMVGLKPQVAAITEATMRGEIKDFQESLRRRVALLAGLEVEALQRVYDERLRLSPGAEDMLRQVRAAGIRTLLVSGGFTFFSERLKARLGLDHAYANTLEVSDGKLTGQVLGAIVDADEKARLLALTCEQMGVPVSQAIAMGDGANDLKMMKRAGMSVAYRAKPVVREQATHAINFGGLDVMPGWFSV